MRAVFILALVLAATAAHARGPRRYLLVLHIDHRHDADGVQMTTWGQIGIAIMELARLKARRRLRAVRRNLLARLVKFRSRPS